MTTQEKYHALKEKIIECVPSIRFTDKVRSIPIGYHTGEVEGQYDRDIQLADVLRAMPCNRSVTTGANSMLLIIGFDDLNNECVYWDLSKTLEDQTPETISFLWDIIVTKNNHD